MAKNPHWIRDELILALDLYFRLSSLPSSEKHPEIMRLSQLLKMLPIHNQSSTDARFRTPDSVYMKLSNFQRLDPNYQGIGLTAGSKLDEVVWNEFASNRDALAKAAASIGHNYLVLSREELALDQGMGAEDENSLRVGSSLGFTKHVRETAL